MAVSIAAALGGLGVTEINDFLSIAPDNRALAREVGLNRMYVARAPEDHLTQDICDALKAAFPEQIEVASEMPEVHVFDAPPTNDTYSGSQWALHNYGQSFEDFGEPYVCPDAVVVPGADINAVAAWRLETGDPAVVVAVLDTGCDLNHPDLAPNLLPGYNFCNGAPVSPLCYCDHDWSDDPPNCIDELPTDEPWDSTQLSHGTFITGIIAAVSDNDEGMAGLAPGCKVRPYRVVSARTPQYCHCYGNIASHVATGVVAAVDEGAMILNLSLGVNAESEDVLKPAIRYALGSDAVVVAAAGNCCMFTEIPYPASDPGTIAVAATTSADTRASFSLTGLALSVAAPGCDVVSTWSDSVSEIDGWACTGGVRYCMGSGTSFAAPHVAGAAALIRSANPALSQQQVKQILEETAEDLGQFGFDPEFGHGRIDAYRAVCAARNEFCPANTNGDAWVDIDDILNVTADWGFQEGCVGDVNCSESVDIDDVLYVMSNWGLCHDSALPPPSLEQVLTASGLSWPSDWLILLNVLESGTASEQQNAICWFEHHVLNCNAVFCQCSGDCDGDSPFGGGE